MIVGDCDTYGWEWTDLASVSDPTVNGLGDFEYVHVHGGCSNPSGIRAQTDDINFSLPVHLNLEKGFWCLNSERFDPTAPDCADFSIQMCCPKFATKNCTDDGYEWSDYINNDGPDGIGDWESRSDTVCASPTAVEASLVSDPFGLINQNIHIDNDLGVYCLNDENDGACEDYAVRFCCPTSAEGTCSTYGYSFGDYLNSDDPDGQGDLELNTNHGSHLVCDAPEAIKAKQVNETEPESDAFTRISVSEGFVCLNDAFNTCNDHEVTYCCPKWAAGNVHCNIQGYEWTDWLNEDNPTDNSGDWETRTSYGERKVCSNPIGVQASPVDENIGSTEITHIDPSIGFWCVNEEQPSGTDCADFEVRFCCPQVIVFLFILYISQKISSKLASRNAMNLAMNGLAGWIVMIQQRVVIMKPLVTTVWKRLAQIPSQSMPVLELLAPLLSHKLIWPMDSGAIMMINQMVKTVPISKSDFAVLKR